MGGQSKTTQIDDADARIRRRLITVAASALCAFGLYFMVRRLVDNPLDASSVFLAMGALLMAGTVVWVRRSSTSHGPAQLMCGTPMVIAIAVAYGNGGSTAPAVEWFIVITMLALFLVGPRTSMVYALISSLAFTIFHFHETLGISLPEPPDAAYLAEVRLFSRVVTLCFVVFIGWRFAREKLRASALAHAAKEDLDVVLRNLPHGVLVVRGGTIHSANDAVARMLDATPAELVGVPMGELLSVPDAGPKRLSQKLAGMQTFESELTSRSGGAVAVRVTPVTLRDVQGKHVLVLSIEDIRHQIALEAQLRTSQRMASLGTMAAGMAHEINNPLASMSANLDYAKSGLGDPKAVAAQQSDLIEALEDSEDGVRRIARIVRDLQIFSVGETPQAKGSAVKVEPCVRAAQRLCRHQLEGLDAVDVEVDPDLTVDGDEGELVRVFVNLLVNAAQAMQGANCPEKRIVVRSRRQGPWAEIEIQDTGPGIDAAIEEQIFDPFFTTKEVGEGMGLGLPICHQLVHKRGGSIRLRSHGEDGTTFTLRLRLRSDTAEAAEAANTAEASPKADAPAASASEHGLTRVLVIEDDAMIVRALRRALAPDTVFVESGAQGLARLEHESFDAILCDMMMPGMDGREFFERLRDRDPQMASRVLFMTGGAFTEDARAFLQRVPNRCLAKPVPPEQLHAALSSLERQS